MKLAIVSACMMFVGITAALAQPPYWRGTYETVRHVPVYTGDLNLSDPADREEAAWRIDHAARFACAPFPDIRAFDEVADYRDCKADAFDDAVAELDHRMARGHRRGHVTTREYPAGH